MPEYVRQIDLSAFDQGSPSTLPMANRETGSEFCRLNLLRLPPGSAGPGLHAHAFDQFYYVVSGTMKLQIGLQEYTAGPNCLVVLPAGVPHRNWNEGPEAEVHIALAVPETAPDEPASVPVTIDAPLRKASDQDAKGGHRPTEYVHQVDFAAFRPDAFHSQRIVGPIVGPGNAVQSCNILCTRVPPGKEGPFHIHTGDQFYYILTGEMNLELAGKHLTAGKNCLVWIPAGAPHRNWNTGSADDIHFELIVPSPPYPQRTGAPIKRL